MIIDIGTSEQLIGRRRNQKENQKHLEINDIGNTAQSSCFVEFIDCFPNRRNKQRAGFLILGSICTLLN